MERRALSLIFGILLIVTLSSVVSAESCLQEMLSNDVTILNATVDNKSSVINFYFNSEGKSCDSVDIDLTDFDVDLMEYGLSDENVLQLKVSNLLKYFNFSVQYSQIDSIIHFIDLDIMGDGLIEYGGGQKTKLKNILNPILTKVLDTDYTVTNITENPSLLDNIIDDYTEDMPDMYGNAQLSKEGNQWTLSYDNGFNDLKEENHEGWFDRTIEALDKHESWGINVTDYLLDTFSWAEDIPYLEDGGDLIINVSTGNLAINDDGKIVRGIYSIPVNFTFKGETETKVMTLIVKEDLLVREVNDTDGDNEEEATEEITIIENTTDTVVFDAGSINVEEIIIPSTISDTKQITLDMHIIMDNTTDPTKATVNVSTNNISLKRESLTQNYSADIQLGTIITGNSTWDGKLILPTVTTITSDSGTVSIAVEMGSTQPLTFSKAVKITLGGMYGKSALYQLANGTQHTIDACTDATDDSEGTLASGGECYLDSSNGNDLIIWTYHFTIFAAYTPSTTRHHHHNYVNSVKEVIFPETSLAEDTGIASEGEPIVLNPKDNARNNNGLFGITGKAISDFVNSSPGKILSFTFFLLFVVFGFFLVVKRNKAKQDKKVKEGVEKDLMKTSDSEKFDEEEDEEDDEEKTEDAPVSQPSDKKTKPKKKKSKSSKK